jgi:HEAT repeat protein
MIRTCLIGCAAVLAVACGSSQTNHIRLQQQATSTLQEIIRQRPRGGAMACDAAVLLFRNGDPADFREAASQLDSLSDLFIFRPVRELGRTGKSEATPLLASISARTDNLLLKVQTALALARLGDTGQIGHLIKILGSDTEAIHRASAASALGELSARPALDALLSALANDSDPFVQASAAAALGKLGDRSAVGPLWQATEKTSQLSVTMAAMDALGDLGGPEAVAHLEEVVKRPTWSELVRRRCLKALDQAQAREIGQYLQSVATDTSNQLLARVQAIEGLGVLHDTSATALLRSAFGSDRRGPLPLASAWSLAHLGAATDLRQEVAKDLNHPDLGFQAHAAEILGIFGQNDQIPVLRDKLLMQTDPVVRSAIVAALAKIGASDAISALVEAFDASETIPAKVEIVLALGQSASSASAEALLQILNRSEYTQVRLAAMEGLGATGDRRALPPLKTFLSSGNPELRLQSAATILRLTTGIWLDPAD